MGWYALFVETGKEEDVKEHINDIMCFSSSQIPYQLLIPKRKITEKREGITVTVVRKMFPGYILLQTEQILDFYLMTKGCYRIFGILRDGSYFKEVRLEEVSNIIYMTDSDGVIGKSDIFVEDDRIIVTNGPLKNYNGFIKKLTVENIV